MVELLRLEKIRKTFPGVVAINNVDLVIEKGEIHALLGENGAGKSALMNCVYGIYRPDSGRIFWKGEEISILHARDAIRRGIGMVHQHFMLVPSLSVAENIILGMPSPKDPFLDIANVEKAIRESSKKYHLEVDPRAKIWQLPVGVQQRVEILKALYRKAELLILDEPTAVLTPGEVENLFEILRELVADGLSIIFITHKLKDVMAACDRVTVLRDGRVVDTVAIGDTHIHELAKMMIGREDFLNVDKPELVPGEVVLAVESLSAYDDRNLPVLKGVTFELKRNEILGIVGVEGNGQTELAQVITGLRAATGGRFYIRGKDATHCGPLEIIQMNVSYIPPDRQQTGLLMDFSIMENLIGKRYSDEPFSRKGILKEKEVLAFASHSIKDFDVRTPGPELPVKFLSGGNQQKVILAREFSAKPDLLIAAQPTRGLDVGATEYVHAQMVEARNNGAAILLISTELEEVLSLSDRIAVLYEGEIMGIIQNKDPDIPRIGKMMAGVLPLNIPSAAEESQA